MARPKICSVPSESKPAKVARQGTSDPNGRLLGSEALIGDAVEHSRFSMLQLSIQPLLSSLSTSLGLDGSVIAFTQPAPCKRSMNCRSR
jgi:hypothetical protein